MILFYHQLAQEGFFLRLDSISTIDGARQQVANRHPHTLDFVEPSSFSPHQVRLAVGVDGRQEERGSSAAGGGGTGGAEQLRCGGCAQEAEEEAERDHLQRLEGKVGSSSEVGMINDDMMRRNSDRERHCCSAAAFDQRGFLLKWR